MNYFIPILLSVFSISTITSAASVTPKRAKLRVRDGIKKATCNLSFNLNDLTAVRSDKSRMEVNNIILDFSKTTDEVKISNSLNSNYSYTFSISPSSYVNQKNGTKSNIGYSLRMGILDSNNKVVGESSSSVSPYDSISFQRKGKMAISLSISNLRHLNIIPPFSMEGITSQADFESLMKIKNEEYTSAVLDADRNGEFSKGEYTDAKLYCIIFHQD